MELYSCLLYTSDLVVNGKCGAFFGLWWTPNNPLMDEYRKNKEADWEPYYLTADVKRTVEVYSTFRDNKYVVVRKGYEHPEIVMKILSVLFDHSRYEAEDADEMNTYFALNVDPTARPLMILSLIHIFPPASFNEERMCKVGKDASSGERKRKHAE